MYKLPEKLQKLVPYHPLEGEYAIRLDANESFLASPPELQAKLLDAMGKVAFNRYPDPYCTELCQAFGDLFGVNPQLVVAGNGSDELIGLIVSSFASAGDSMVVVSPDFSMYGFYAQMNAVKVHAFTKDADALSMDANGLIAFAKEVQAKIVILSNPCNPTSLSASKEDILKIVTQLDCLVVIDEAYMDFSNGSILPLAEQYDNLIVLKTCSKAFGMAAIRLGFAAASEPIANALKAAKSPYNVNSLTQAAGTVLLSQRDYLEQCVEQIKVSRDALYLEISNLAKVHSAIIKVYDTCANFVFVRLQDASIVFKALGKQGIAVRCMEPYLRITAGSEAENRAVVAALEQILQRGEEQ